MISRPVGSTAVGGVAGVGGEPCGRVCEGRRVFTWVRSIVKELFEVDVGVVICVSISKTRVN